MRWVVFHAGFFCSPGIEYLILNVPEEETVSERTLLGDLSVDRNCALNPKLMLVLDHIACPLHEAPHEIRCAYDAGKIGKIIQWSQLWHLIASGDPPRFLSAQ